MAIEKNCFKVARFNPEYHSPHSRDTVMSSDDDDFQRRNSTSAVESDDDEDDDEFDDCDSGAGSDDFDLLELGETGEEFCQVGGQTCSIPYELYDLPGLKDVLSMEVWNEVLTEEDRFGLAKYLPDMDQENFVRTLKEIYSGDSLHFGNPVDQLFDMLKIGLCEPRVALYRQGLNFLQRRTHYHNLRKHQNTMVTNVCQIRDAWLNCKGYSIEEKLRVLNIMKSQKSLMNENMEDFGSESSDREESGDGLWGKKVKDQNLGQKYSGYGTGAASDISSRGWKANTESAKHGKQNPIGNSKFAGSKNTPMEVVVDRFPSTHLRVGMKSGRYNIGVPLSRYNNPASHDSVVATRMNEQMKEDDGDEEETMYEVAVHRDQNYLRVGAQEKPGASKFGKKHEGSRGEEDSDSITRIPISGRNDLRALGRNKTINQLSDIKVLTARPSHVRNIYDGMEKVKYSENLQQFTAEKDMKIGKGQKSNLYMKGSQIELLHGSDIVGLGKPHDGMFPADVSYKPSDLTAKSKKWKMSRETVGLNPNDKLLHNEHRNKTSRDKFWETSLQSGRQEGVGNRGNRTFGRSEDTDSDSSEQMDDDENDNPLMRSKWAYPGGVADLKYDLDSNKTKLSTKVKKHSYRILDGSLHSSRKMDGYSKNLETTRADQMGKMHDVGYSNNFPTTDLDKTYFSGPGHVIGNAGHKKINMLGRNGYVEGNHGRNFHMASLKSRHTLEGRLKGEVRHDSDSPQSHYAHDYSCEDELFCRKSPHADNAVPFKLGKNVQRVEQSTCHYPERSGVPLIGCNALSKKRKIKDDPTYMEMRDNNDFLHIEAQLRLDDMSTLRKRGKNKVEDAPDAPANEISGPTFMEHETEDVKEETKPQKKSFPLIIPTVHTGFSFSIIHLLSAVRVAMITLLPENSSEAGKPPDMNDSGQGIKEENLDNQQRDANVVNSNSTMDIHISMPSAQANVPSLTVQDIVNRVRSNPGDPCILETQEPLQDLVRGVLKIFSSRTAPLGAKGWKPLVVYEKSTKGWSWIGPVSHNDFEEAVEEVTSPDAWGLPHKMLVKLVDSFANWLKNSQDTLQQIGSLPVPPLTLMQINLDEKERFKDLRAQKSLSTISQSSEEVRTYFRKEEVLRYLIPDRAFSYTAVDGKKSIVAPLRRCGGKPTSKARDHFMLKRDRPPHVTILCLVRDAAARLPGSIGTRADVCTLIRDSQYIVEDVSDAQVNQVVSGALDRLHYERDPCVQFDGERKLWVYLHREREEEDFEDDGTSSTKKWRRQKKEATEPSDNGDVTVAYPGHVEQPALDLVSDLNVEASCADNDKGLEPDYHNSNDNVEHNAETSHGSDQSMHHGPTPVMWNGLELNSIEENKLAHKQNSVDEDFDEDAFDGEPPA
ncbi:hypothetical protein ACJIZ3_020628 [Penstemon smallii]|uniref:DEUBAD domain-containing protein n=1 Tax=Penstemon smallii TaxID=265156 RepID=A0ABD3SJ52_9LAMI